MRCVPGTNRKWIDVKQNFVVHANIAEVHHAGPYGG